MTSSPHNFENTYLGRYRKSGKKLFLLAVGLLCTFSFGGVQADAWDDIANIGYKVGEALGDANKWVGDRGRESQDWQMEQEYNNRPLSERDLSFEEWKEIKGYTTRDGGILPTGDFSVTDYRQDFGSEIGENASLRAYLKKVINFVLSFLGVIATAMLIYAGYLYVTAGDGDGAEKAKKILIYVAIGIIIILASYAIVNTLIRNAGREGFDDRCAVLDNQTDCDANISCQWINSQCETRDFPRGDGAAATMTGQIGVTLASGGPFYRTDGGYIALPNTTLQFQVASPAVASGSWDIGDGVPRDLGTALDVPFYDTGMRLIRGRGLSESGQEFGVGVVVLVGEPINPRFSMPTMAGFGRPISVQDQSTTPPRAGSIVKYIWECVAPANVDEAEDACPDMSGFQKNFSMTFEDGAEGEYTIRMTVESNLKEGGDESGDPATATTENTIWVSPSGGIDGRSGLNESGLNAQFFPNKSTISLGSAVIADATSSRGAVEYSWKCWKDYPSNPETENNACPVLDVEWSTNEFESFPFKGKSGEEMDIKYTGEYYLSLKVRDGEENESKTIHKKIIVLPEIPMDRPPARVKYKVSLVGQLNNFFQGLQAQSIGDVIKDLWESAFGNQTIEIYRGQEILFEKDIPENSPYFDTEAYPSQETWYWNGNQQDSAPTNIGETVGLHRIKLVMSDARDPNKKDTILLNVKVKNNLPEVKIISVETMEDDPAIPPAYARVKVEANDDADGAYGGIREYKIEAHETGRYLTMAFIPTDKEEIEALINLSPYPGVRAFVFKATVTDTDHEKASDQSIVMTIDVPYVNDPMVSFTSSKTNAHTEEPLEFYPSATGFPEGEEVTYTWYWGDGSEEESTEDSLDHAFDLSGNRRVRLVAESETATAEATKMINIINPFGSGNEGNHSPTVDIIGMAPGNTGDTDTIFTFCVEVEDLDGDELSYKWAMGDGNIMNVKNVGYQYETPGTYIVYVTVSDGILSATDSQVITVVAAGQEIPESTIEYCPPSGDSVLGDNVAIGSFTNNLESFAEELSHKEQLLREALANETDLAKQEQLKKCIETSQKTQEKIHALEKENDPLGQQKLNNEITVLLKELHKCDPTIDSRFITVRGTPDTTFFFYGYAPTSGDRPLLFRWETEDGQSFVGQDISTKFSVLGVYEVKMIVTDGLAEATAALNVKIAEPGELEKSANLGAEVIDLSNPPKQVEKTAPSEGASVMGI